METALSGVDTVRLWQQALGELQLQTGRDDFRTWFEDAELVSYDGSTCVVGHGNPLVLPWLEARCSGLLARTLESLVGAPVRVQFAPRPPASPAQPQPPLELDSPPPTRRARRSATAKEPPSRPQVGRRLTFANFVVGESNQLAHAACVAAAERPGETHNPLFIYGAVGLGKTHLLHAIGHHTLASDLAVVYVSSESFTNEYIDAVRRNRMDAFRARYRQADILLVDDVQFIAGKEQTQEEFFHTFNQVYDEGGQIVLTSDRPPRAISTLAQRLQSRFSGGLVADIQPPSFETRVAILQSKLQSRARPVEVPAEALTLIAERVTSNVRELEGALNRVLAQAELLGREVTPDLARAALESALPAPGGALADPEAILKAVCGAAGLTRRALEGAARDRRTAEARHLAMYVLREHTSLSLAEIGALLGGRDHSTVLHGHGRIAARLEQDQALRQLVASIRERLDLLA